MKKITIFLLCTFILLFGCQQSYEEELPPQPGTPGGSDSPIGQAVGTYSGYAPPFSVFEQDGAEPFPIVKLGDGTGAVSIDFDDVVIQPSDTQVPLVIDVNLPGGYIYKNGYILDANTNGWDIPVQLSGTELTYSDGSGSGYLDGTGTLTMQLDRNALHVGGGSSNFLLVYACKNYPSVTIPGSNMEGFECGCSSTTGPCDQWMIHYFTVTEQGTASCTDGDTRCTTDSQAVETCTAGVYGNPQFCNNGCTAGVCDAGAFCISGNQQCFGDVLKTCNAAGDDYESPQTCQHGCTAGACDAAPGACTEGDLRCESSSGPMQICDATGNWIHEQACAFVCQDPLPGGCMTF
jgi:hypothetical protein